LFWARLFVSHLFFFLVLVNDPFVGLSVVGPVPGSSVSFTFLTCSRDSDVSVCSFSGWFRRAPATALTRPPKTGRSRCLVATTAVIRSLENPPSSRLFSSARSLRALSRCFAPSEKFQKDYSRHDVTTPRISVQSALPPPPTFFDYAFLPRPMGPTGLRDLSGVKVEFFGWSNYGL